MSRLETINDGGRPLAGMFDMYGFLVFLMDAKGNGRRVAAPPIGYLIARKP
jgi:hypothetical protein